MGGLTVGVDVGQRRDPTAVVRLGASGAVLGAHRLRLGQDWARIVAGVAELAQDADVVVVDATGVGSPVAEALRARVGGRVEPFTFTAPSKRGLIQTLATVINSGRLTIPPGIPGREELRDELTRFAATPTPTGWRFSGKATGHDDLVMALALAVRGQQLLKVDGRVDGYACDPVKKRNP